MTATPMLNKRLQELLAIDSPEKFRAQSKAYQDLGYLREFGNRTQDWKATLNEARRLGLHNLPNMTSAVQELVSTIAAQGGLSEREEFDREVGRAFAEEFGPVSLGAIQGVGDIVGLGARATDIAGLTEGAASGQQEMSRSMDIAKSEQGEGMLAQNIRGITRSLTPYAVGGFGAKALAKTAAAKALPWLAKAAQYSQYAVPALVQSNQAYEEGKRQGLKGEKLSSFAALEGITEFLWGALFHGASKLSPKLSWLAGTEEAFFQQRAIRESIRKSVADSIRRFGKNQIAEQIEEQATSLSQAWLEEAYGTDPRALDFENLLLRIRDTAIQTFGMGGAVHGVMAATAQRTERADLSNFADQMLRLGTAKNFIAGETASRAALAKALGVEKSKLPKMSAADRNTLKDIVAGRLLREKTIKKEEEYAEKTGREIEAPSPQTRLQQEEGERLRIRNAEKYGVEATPGEAVRIERTTREIFDDPDLNDDQKDQLVLERLQEKRAALGLGEDPQGFNYHMVTEEAALARLDQQIAEAKNELAYSHSMLYGEGARLVRRAEDVVRESQEKARRAGRPLLPTGYYTPATGEPTAATAAATGEVGTLPSKPARAARETAPEPVAADRRIRQEESIASGAKLAAEAIGNPEHARTEGGSTYFAGKKITPVETIQVSPQEIDSFVESLVSSPDTDINTFEEWNALDDETKRRILQDYAPAGRFTPDGFEIANEWTERPEDVAQILTHEFEHFDQQNRTDSELSILKQTDPERYTAARENIMRQQREQRIETRRREVIAWGQKITQAIASKLPPMANRADVNKALKKVGVTEADRQRLNIPDFMRAAGLKKINRDAMLEHIQGRINKIAEQEIQGPESGPVAQFAIRKRKAPPSLLETQDVAALQPKSHLPMAELPSEANLPDGTDLTAPIAELWDTWWANKDDRITAAEIDAQNLQREIMEAVGENRFGNESKKADQAIQLYIDLKGKSREETQKYGDKLNEEQRDILLRSQNLSPALKAVAEKIITLNRKAGLEGVEREVLNNVVDNYTMRLWDFGEKEKRPIFKKFGTTTERAKQRKLDSILHGWSLGYKLKVRSASNAQLIARTQLAQAIEDRNLIKLGIKQGVISRNQHEGYTRVDHPNFKDWFFAGQFEEGKSYGKNFFITEEGTVFERRDLYAPNELAKKLNNVLAKGYSGPVLDFTLRWNAILKAQLLFTSFFHHQAFLRSYMLAGHGLNPIAGYRAGEEAIRNYTPELRDLVRGGLTIGRIADFDELALQQETLIDKAIDRIPVAGDIRKQIVDFRNRQTDFLFKKLGPALKVQAGILQYQSLLSKHKKKLESGKMTRHDLAKIAANIVNDDFGGLHLGRMARNQNTQKIMRLLLLAPDWTESNFRSLVNAFRGDPTSRAAYQKMWLRVLAKGGLSTILFNILASGFDDEDWLERYKKAWKEGRLRWLDIDITPLYRALGGRDEKRKYFSLIGHFKDPLKWAVHPIQSAQHKGSIFASLLSDAMEGADWAGRPFTSIDELLGIDEKGVYKTTRRGHYVKGQKKGGKLRGQTVRPTRRGGGSLEYKQLPSFILNQAKGTLPIQVQAMADFLNGEIDAFDAVSHSLGFHTATTYPEKRKR